jgi:hypothetical protein
MAGDIKFDVKVNNKITTDLIRKQQQITKLPEQAFHYWKSITPIHSGNARRKTRFDRANEQIVADYPYAEVLDQGRGVRDGQMRGSTQAPKGMSKPTEEYIAKQLQKIMRK